MVSYLNTLLFSVIIIISLTSLLVKSFTFNYDINSSGYVAINKLPLLKNYGTVYEENDRISDIGSNTMVTPEKIAICRQPWSVYNCLRVSLSLIQLIFVVCFTLSLLNQHDSRDMDNKVEGSYNDIVIMYYTRIAFWVKKKKKR